MKKGNRNKFRLTRFVIFRLAWILKVLSHFRPTKKRLLIVRLDAIGDYVLFRNYLEVLRNAQKFKDYEIELLGNSRWEDLAIKYDSSFVSRIRFINPDDLYERPLDTLKLGLSLFRRRYEVVLQPTYSRTLIESGLSAFAAGKLIIGYNSIAEHHAKYKKRTDRFYDTLISLEEDKVHETEINHHFFQEVLKQPIPVVVPTLNTVVEERKGILVFPGSSMPEKNWESDKFLEIIIRILSNCGEEVIIAGGTQEMGVAAYIKSKINSSRVVDQTGSTTLPDFINLIAGSRLVISNDTNAVHVAAACKVPAVCILGGGYFKRFLPYPEFLPSKPVAVYAAMPCYGCRFLCDFTLEKNEPYPCISKVDIEQVWLAVSRLLNESVNQKSQPSYRNTDESPT